MTIEQTVEIPANHRLTDEGMETPDETPPRRRLSVEEAIEKCRGIAKDSSLTSDRSIELRRRDKELEEARHRRLFGVDGDQA